MSDLDDLFPTLSADSRSRSNLMAPMVSRENRPERIDKIGIPLNLAPLREEQDKPKVVSRKPRVKHTASTTVVDGVRLSVGARLTGDDLRAHEAAVELSRHKWEE
ncbi:MAG TPA: hypothetical protein EYQ05_02845 [Gammaproteobacteria bacterium]|nr:hypothetical protein [Gammaproteobacteria bacterium]